MTFDTGAFRTWLLLDHGMEPITAKVTLKRLDYMQRHGFDMERFVAGAASAHLLGRGWLEKRLNASTVHAFNNDVLVLNALAKYCGHQNVQFARRTPPRTSPKALDRSQIRRLTQYSHPFPDTNRFRRALILLHLETGARPSEVARLELQDLDPKLSRVHIRFPAKRGMIRWIPVSPWIWSPKRPLGAYLRHRLEPRTNPNAVWVTERGHGAEPRRMSQDYMRNAFQAVSRDVGFRVNANVLRHTKATEMRRRGFDILYIKFVLGHASISSTQIYAEINADDVATLYKRRPTPDYYQEPDNRND